MEEKSDIFNNTHVAFFNRSDKELKRAYWLFKMLSFRWLVQIGPAFVRIALFLRLPIKGLIRATVFRQFCGGETIEDCNATIHRLSESNIGTILDYSVEGKESTEDFNHALSETLETIKRATGDTNIPFCVFKPTGFARFSLLEKVNTEAKLSSSEEKEYAEFISRIEKICSTAYENNVPVFIDAEESWIQNSVDVLARNLMIKYNKDKIIIYNTIQMYRTGRIDVLNAGIAHARKEGYKAGFKIVRGAYMEKERKRAVQMNIPSPIQPDKESTDNEYNSALRISIDNIDMLGLCCGTHNEESCYLLIKLMNEKKIKNNHSHIWFSQLFGMSDHISYNLASKGYNVCKYVPYGPVEEVLPYLTRRAQENTSVAGQTSRELSLLEEELKRRRVIQRG